MGQPHISVIVSQFFLNKVAISKESKKGGEVKLAHKMLSFFFLQVPDQIRGSVGSGHCVTDRLSVDVLSRAVKQWTMRAEVVC